MRLSNHAIQRFRQRGFKAAHINLILLYGRCTKKRGHAQEVQFFQKDMPKIKSGLSVSDIQNFDKCKNKVVLISNDGCVITAYAKI